MTEEKGEKEEDEDKALRILILLQRIQRMRFLS